MRSVGAPKEKCERSGAATGDACAKKVRLIISHACEFIVATN